MSDRDADIVVPCVCKDPSAKDEKIARQIRARLPGGDLGPARLLHEVLRYEHDFGCDVQTTELLLMHGADANEASDGGLPLLTAAVSRGEDELAAKIARILLRHKANVNQRSSSPTRQTALHSAALIGNVSCVKVLVEAKADSAAVAYAAIGHGQADWYTALNLVQLTLLQEKMPTGDMGSHQEARAKSLTQIVELLCGA